MDVTILRPKGFDLDPQITESIRTNTEENGQELYLTDDVEEAYAGAHVVYAKNSICRYIIWIPIEIQRFVMTEYHTKSCLVFLNITSNKLSGFHYL